jgi:hypothetical protein
MDGLLQRMVKEGARAALAAFGLPGQPGPGSVGIKGPKSANPLPPPAKMPLPAVPSTAIPPAETSPTKMLGAAAPKVAFNVGMGASTSSDGAGAQAGEPVDTARRQRSVIDRAFQRNEDDYASSSMPLPGDVVSP